MVYNHLMSLLLEAVKHKPVGLFPMDDTSPLQDYSQNNRVATYTGTPARHSALVSGAAYAPVLKSGTVATFETPLFLQGQEARDFSLMATVFLVASGTTQTIQILGHDGQYDGLCITNTVVSFSTKYLTTGESKCSFDLQSSRSVDIVSVHTRNKNTLYIDGVMVAESNISNAQQSDKYVATNGNLYSGQTTSTSGIAVNAIGYFDRALTGNEIAIMHAESRHVPNTKDITPMFGGERLAMSREAADIFAYQLWTTAADWYSAQLSGTAVRNNMLVPQFSSGVSMPGKWYDAFTLTSADTTSIYGVNLDWQGDGASVDVSLDGAAWTPVDRGINVSIIPPGFDPTDKQLLIRISFPGGITNDTSYVDNLTVTGVRSAVSSTWSGRTVTFSNAFQQKDAGPLSFDHHWGAKVNAGGTITITPDTNEQGVIARSLEVWIRADDANAAVNVTGTTYQNGVSTAASLPIGQWTLLHIVPSAAITGNIVITGAAQVGQVGVYSKALSASDVSAISLAYSGANVLRVGDNSPISISESPDAVEIYSHNWSILSAG